MNCNYMSLCSKVIDYQRVSTLLDPSVLYCYMFRSYDHRQAENILIGRVTQLTTDPLISHAQQDADTQD
jgi:hypothetical protein